MNKKYDQLLEEIALEFTERLPNYSQILSICHTDADGIASSVIIKELLKNHLNFKQFFFSLSLPWREYMDSLSINREVKTVIFFSDLCAPISVLQDIVQNYPLLDIFILDHHLYDHKKLQSISDRIFNGNPTQFGLHGLKEIVGAAVNYLFCKNIDHNIRKLAWIAAIGINGDTLQHIDQMMSYNLSIVQEAQDLGQLQIKNGLCLFGGQFDRIDRALSSSILPFVSKVGGQRKEAKNILNQLKINPKTKVEELSQLEIKKISAFFDISSLKGDYIIFPNKSGILRYGFEHAQVLSLVGNDNIYKAIQLFGSLSINQEAKSSYLEYNGNIVKNLSTFVSIKKKETEYSIIVDLTDIIPNREWSDTGSLASINEIYDSNKILFIGGLIESEFKYSVRCTNNFITSHNGKGVNIIIQQLAEIIGASGGGHGLAGGIRFDSSKTKKFLQNIDSIIRDL